MENEVEEQSKFVFNAKIRKLLKKLLEYILKKYYNSYMEYNERSNRLYFIDIPKILSGKNREFRINALNKILNIIFNKTKHADYSLHFVSKNVMENNALRKDIIVFKKCDDFFQYFEITKYKDILIKIIPENYFTSIDNIRFEEKIPDLLAKYCR